MAYTYLNPKHGFMVGFPNTREGQQAPSIAGRHTATAIHGISSSSDTALSKHWSPNIVFTRQPGRSSEQRLSSPLTHDDPEGQRNHTTDAVVLRSQDVSKDRLSQVNLRSRLPFTRRFQMSSFAGRPTQSSSERRHLETSCERKTTA